ncbi:cytochrome c oxidase assembly factor Coa1 family protein [Flavobacterium sp. ENC]|uniref:cytochrome c oxidase assembly factor Coa1 family protein n=1 Tax=Flavobacterium sp. ENC TaxID=2897330 RepID=UPI001E2E0AE6|nr:cytochrome c oxidase assembly factor Coa1 family protein [Flavobacterium sp. ENC]MCD0466285.1 cytochrome c oxidase assembly factor 1 family protein [Flavobacterium sp. ENC]
MEENYNEVKKNWWDRNWKWFVPTGCLSLIVLFGLFIAGIFFGVTSFMKDSDVYKDAIYQVRQNKEVIQQLGSPVETDGMPSGSINVSNNTGECDLEIPIKGSKGTGILFVTAHKRVKWTYDELTVYVNATEKEINLLEK